MFKRPLPLGPSLSFALALSVAALGQPSLAQDAPTSDSDKGVYGLGYVIGSNVAAEWRSLGLNESEMKIAQSAFLDALKGEDPKTDVEAALQLFQQRQEAAAKAALEELKAQNQEILDKEAAAEGATVTASGLIHSTLTEGSGDAPAADSTVKVHYRGTRPDGNEFDSSYKRGEPASFNLGQVIPCFREGIQTMKVGGKSRLVCPPEIAYGSRGAGEAIPPHSVLVFEVELIGIE